MKTTAAVLLALIHTSSAATVSLNADNWDIETAGKAVFVKYFAPWCGHCQAMKDDFDKLAEDFAGRKDTLVAEVDCDGEGSALCDSHGIEGYPTIKYGDPTSLEEYQFERDYSEMKNFASDLKPVCSPTNLDLCDAEKKAAIEKFLKMDIADLKKDIKKMEDQMTEANEKQKAIGDRINEEYMQMVEEKEEKEAEIKGSGLLTMKMVYAAMMEDSEEPASDEL